MRWVEIFLPLYSFDTPAPSVFEKSRQLGGVEMTVIFLAKLTSQSLFERLPCQAVHQSIAL